jgi:hypothetical protein
MPEISGICINAYGGGISLDISMEIIAKAEWVYLNLYPPHVSLSINITPHPCYV